MDVMEDIDFKEPVSREQLMELAADLMPRVSKPIEQALSTAGMAMENIDQVILVGGGSRVPKVQEILTDFVGSDWERASIPTSPPQWVLYTRQPTSRPASKSRSSRPRTPWSSPSTSTSHERSMVRKA